MKTYAFTHSGSGKKRNEDRYLIKEMQDGMNLLVVADGMGGEAAGDCAAEVTRDMLAEIQLGAWGNDLRLSYLVKKIDRIIYAQSQIDTSLEGMGTTITGVFLRNGIANWVHVGDSRLYLWRDWKLVQVTNDQNMARFLVEEGEITEEEARTHGARHQLDQCVGCGSCEPATGNLAVKRGDLLLLVTDGFHEIMPAEKITSFLKANKDFETIAMDLNQAVLDMGCEDDATVVMAEM